MQYPSSPLRILPITVAACCLMIVVKTAAILQGASSWEEVLASSAVAEEQKEDAKPEEKAAAEEEEEAKKEPEAADSEEKKAEGDKKEEPAEGDGADKAKEGEESGTEGDNKADKKAEEPKPEELAEKCKFNQIEVDLLQSLSARRQEIEKWADDVKMQANVLKATEMQIDQKIAQMQKLQADVQAILKKYNSKENVEMKSLVKIYENMKPSAAAAIFNEMEMNILLEVVDMMSERKASAILAGMDPKKAKDLTIELAEKRKLKQDATAGVDIGEEKTSAEPAPEPN